MTSIQHISDEARRRRLLVRHHLTREAPSIHEAVRALVALHSSDPITPHLALQARVPGFQTEDLDRALADEATLWRLHAMRRTLFVVERRHAPAILAAATADVAAKERRRIEGCLAQVLTEPPADWMAAREAEINAHLASADEPLSTAALQDALPLLRTEILLGGGKHTQRAPVGSRLLFLMAMDGRIVRARPLGTWRASQYRWVSADAWLDAPLRLPPRDDASAEVLRAYLASHGPATLNDLRWWSGWTLKQTRDALARLQTTLVRLDDGETGYVLSDDLDTPEAPEPCAALLPGLDSTPMGWKDRAFYLGPHAGPLYDTNGNIGPTVWWAGRIVGGWAQRPGGEVAFKLLEDPGDEARRAIQDRADALAAWLDGASITPRFRTPLERELSATPSAP